MNSYYSCLDTLLIAPQAEQHDLIKRMAYNNNGKIVFYGAEEYFVARSQPFILNKLKRTPNLNGVIFFTIDQFCYGEKFNTELMLNIVKIGLSIHFARENISVLNLKDLKIKYVEFISYYHCKKSEQNFVNEYHFL
jgi:hypothetical protein